MVYTINGAPLLTDFSTPYTFNLDSRRWGDGSYTIAAYATMRDNFQTTTVSSQVSFANGLRNGVPNNNHFTPTAGTSPAPGAPLVLSAVGDGADGASGETGAVGLISSWNPNLNLYLGDVYEDGLPMEFNNWYGNAGQVGTYGQLRSITDPVIGNHEYVGSDASGYFYYWDNIPHYYSFNSHGWHFIALEFDVAVQPDRSGHRSVQLARGRPGGEHLALHGRLLPPSDSQRGPRGLDRLDERDVAALRPATRHARPERPRP